MKSRVSDIQTIIDKEYDLFDCLSEEEKQLLLENSYRKVHKSGDYIYKEEEDPVGLIFLLSGKAKIVKSGVGGREQIVRMLKPVGFIGYRALFAEEHYISSAVALEDSSTCIIKKETLFYLMRNNGQLGLNIVKRMALELGFSNTQTVILTQKHIRGRLADSLLFLKDTYGTENDGQTLNVYLSREDLATLSNMTTSNAIRTLSSFAKEEVIDLKGRKIKVINFELLNRISELG